MANLVFSNSLANSSWAPGRVEGLAPSKSWEWRRHLGLSRGIGWPWGWHLLSPSVPPLDLLERHGEDIPV